MQFKSKENLKKLNIFYDLYCKMSDLLSEMGCINHGVTF
jgi:hypothetical protein